MECGGVEKIMDKAAYISSSEDKLWIQIIPNTSACIRNMIINDGKWTLFFMGNHYLKLISLITVGEIETDRSVNIKI